MKEPNEPEKKPSKGRRAKGQTQTSISLSEEILRRARTAAEKDRRSFSQWIEMLLDAYFKRIDAEAEAEIQSKTIAAFPDHSVTKAAEDTGPAREMPIQKPGTTYREQKVGNGK